jgi:hypothetical protein
MTPIEKYLDYGHFNAVVIVNIYLSSYNLSEGLSPLKKLYPLKPKNPI